MDAIIPRIGADSMSDKEASTQWALRQRAARDKQNAREHHAPA
jgi:hypothetical protein